MYGIYDSSISISTPSSISDSECLGGKHYYCLII